MLKIQSEKYSKKMFEYIDFEKKEEEKKKILLIQWYS